MHEVDYQHNNVNLVSGEYVLVIGRKSECGLLLNAIELCFPTH
jgi:hypothetical protein